MHKITSPRGHLARSLTAVGTTEQSVVEAYCVLLNAQLLPSLDSNAGDGFFVESTFVSGISSFKELKTYMKNVYDLELTYEDDDDEPNVAIRRPFPSSRKPAGA